jgi:Protein of unknown function (DUF1593)/PKD domain
MDCRSIPALATLCFLAPVAQAAAPKTRIVVMTDISTLTADQGEPDDTQSLIRFLLYTNHFDVEGLIATHTSNPVPHRVNPQFIHALVDAYAQVRGNLVLHDARYPAAEYLHQRVKAGSEDRGAVGEGHDTEASDWIAAMVDRVDSRPLWFSIWGGARELAQALWKVDRTRPQAKVREFESKIRVYAVYDQDGTGKWIAEHHPRLFYITGSDTVRGMYREGDTSLCTPEWIDKHVRTGHGALGAAYPNYRGGDPWGRVYGMKEGDTPSFLYLMPNGPGVPERPELESWGGRFEGPGPRYQGAGRSSVYGWREAYQNSFAARLEWCVRPLRQANHEPLAAIAGPAELRVAPGEKITLDASASIDPDGDALAYRWQSESLTGRDTAARVTVVAPYSGTAEVLLTVTDNGSPPLAAYRRVSIQVTGPGR